MMKSNSSSRVRCVFHVNVAKSRHVVVALAVVVSAFLPCCGVGGRCCCCRRGPVFRRRHGCILLRCIVMRRRGASCLRNWRLRRPASHIDVVACIAVLPVSCPVASVLMLG